MSELQGRNRGKIPFGKWPEDLQNGDYWLITQDDGELIESPEPGNLTKLIMGMKSPNGCYAQLTKHTVRINDDDTLSVLPGDGSSNSILVSCGGDSWHGYLYNGVWKEV